MSEDRRNLRTADIVLCQCLATLTPRHREILRLVLVGRRNKQIAYELGLSPPTIENDRREMMRRMGASTAGELGSLVGRAAKPWHSFPE
jgi:FixJ family two-component response regulator